MRSPAREGVGSRRRVVVVVLVVGVRGGAKNPDEKIYLDFGDHFSKIDQKSFPPGSQP